MADLRETFETMVDEALEPEGYPDDGALVEYDPKIDGEAGHGLLDGGPIPVGDAEKAKLMIPARVRWQPTDIGAAAWCARRYARAAQVIDEAVEMADELRAQADRFEAQVRAANEGTMRFFEWKLREFHAERIAGQKSSTVQLPGSKLTGRIGSVSTLVDNLPELMKWLKKNAPDVIVPPTPQEARPDLNAIKSRFGGKVDPKDAGTYPAVDPDGVVVPGVKLVRGEPTFKVEIESTEVGL